jgi:hypothetical protein
LEAQLVEGEKARAVLVSELQEEKLARARATRAADDAAVSAATAENETMMAKEQLLSQKDVSAALETALEGKRKAAEDQQIELARLAHIEKQTHLLEAELQAVKLQVALSTLLHIQSGVVRIPLMSRISCAKLHGWQALSRKFIVQIHNSDMLVIKADATVLS